MDYEFIQNDCYYAFRGYFKVKAKLDYIKDFIFNFENIAKYTPGVKSIELIRKGENWYDVKYTYRKLIFLKNQSTWRRTLKRDQLVLAIDMISNRTKTKLLPTMVASTGYFQIKPDIQGYRVEYFQECELKNGLFQNLYIHMTKNRTIKFLQVLKKSILETCERYEKYNLDMPQRNIF